MAPGTIVAYAHPEDALEASLRFVVLDATAQRVTLRCLNLPDWSPALAPVEVVAPEQIRPVERP
jgi:hypothetical protein